VTVPRGGLVAVIAAVVLAACSGPAPSTRQTAPALSPVASSSQMVEPWQTDFDRLADHVSLEDFVRALPRRDAIPALFRQAEAVAYPSLVEGFGLPALEALACGAPLVSTSGSAIEEVVGDAALLVPPGDAAALAAALERILDDPGESARLRKAGPLQAAGFTWEASVAQHVEAYLSAGAATLVSVQS